ncbi:MAG: hypothetical protein KJI72_03050 [Patescibacteria group bacterium]|nr:hypothetical protein [Patescibacteria group bacterium]
MNKQESLERIIKHFKNKDFDIRKKHPGHSRFMDQKVTPDVLQFIAECIIQYTGSVPGPFTSPEIEHSDYFVKNVTRTFNKPTPKDKRTKHEYDKWPAQIIQTLRFAKVLEEHGKKGRAVAYVVTESEILEYISLRSQNAYTFLFYYLTKLLKDSGFYKHFERYRDLYVAGKLDKADFYDFKKRFKRFIFAYTEIKKDYEPRRIFPKVINVLASEHRIPGTIHGHMSKFPFMMSDLIYNRINFRDKDKSKHISRQEQKEQEKDTKQRNKSVYRISKAKKRIKELHTQSEIKDQWSTGKATQIHHIFPEKEFLQLADRLENLIRLTATQHNEKAHPNNDTSVIDREYQYICLIEKSYSVEESIKKGEFDYSRESFIGVINAGLKQNIPYDSSFEEIRTALKKIYSA